MADDRPPTRLTVRTNVRTLLDRTGQTQAQLAAAMRMHFSKISRRMLGKDRFSLDDLDLIAAHFKVTVAQLVSVDGVRKRPVRPPTR